jgi:hypothetical protein
VQLNQLNSKSRSSEFYKKSAKFNRGTPRNPIQNRRLIDKAIAQCGFVCFGPFGFRERRRGVVIRLLRITKEKYHEMSSFTVPNNL